MSKSKKILMVAMPSLHFFRWVDQLKDAGFEVFWFDITGAGNFVERISWVHQITDWKLRWDFPGRIFIKKKLPGLYSSIQKWNEREISKIFQRKLKEIKPDMVHSFALYVACAPIFSVMKGNPDLKWIYSSWGSDLFYFQNNQNHLRDIKRILPRLNFLFTDCQRDYKLADKYGFQGEFLGVFPGGGGFDLNLMRTLKIPFKQRNLILIKGYQGRSGRAIPVLKAVRDLRETLMPYQIVIFGADKDTEIFLKQHKMVSWPNLQVFGKISQEKVWSLMGKSIIYVGNSNSDGIPNTLLEAIIMGVFPIQSNPGGVTEEVIENGVNGFLIKDCENSEELSLAIQTGLSLSKQLIDLPANNMELINSISRASVRNKIISKYMAALIDLGKSQY